MNNKKNIKNNIIYSIISIIITIILGLIIPRIILKGYGSEVNGLVISVSQFIVYLGLFESGIQGTAKQSLYKPVCLSQKEEINKIMAAVNIHYKKIGILYLVFLVLLSCIYPIFVHLSSLNYIAIFCIVFFSGFGNVIVFFFHGKYKILMEVEGKNYIITNLQTIVNILNNLLKITLLALKINISIVIMCSFLVSLIQVIYIEILIKKKYNWINLKVEPNYSSISQRKSMLLHQIAGMIFQNTDVLILTIFCNLKVVSIYSLYKMIINHLDSIINAIYNSFDFRLGQIYNTNIKNFVNSIDIIESYFSTLVFSIYTVTCCVMSTFIKIYTAGINDANYVDERLVILFVICELLTYMRLPMLKVIHYAGKFNETLIQTVIESIINLIVSIICVKKFGIYGVLFGTLVALLYRTFDIIIYSNNKLLQRKSLKTFSIYFVNIILMLIIFIGYSSLKIEINNLLYFFMNSLFLLIICIFIFFITQTLIYNKNKKFILEIMKNKLKII